MKKQISHIYRSFGIKLLLLAVAGLVIVTSTSSSLFASGDERFISLYVDGQSQNMITDADTVSEVLDELQLSVHEADTVEPALDTELTGVGYQINVYRSRPVRVVYGDKQPVDVRSASYSPAVVAEAAGYETYPEDEYQIESFTKLDGEGFIGDRVLVNPSTPLTLAFDGYQVEMRTQAETVEQLLEEQGLNLTDDDYTTPKRSATIEPGSKVSVVRVGEGVETEEETIKYEVVQTTDYTKEVGYREVTTEGRDGRAILSYRTEQRGQAEPKRKLISRTVVEKVQDEVVTVGGGGTLTEASSSGNWERLAQCESGGNWSINTGNGYYGGLQFSLNSWRGVGGSGYPHEASKSEQIARAERLRASGGWGHWPACSSKLGLR